MEQNLNNEIETDLISFQVEYKDQKVKNLPSFKTWYERANSYVKDINKKNIKLPKKMFRSSKTVKLLTISFCNNCNSYSICSICNKLSLITCQKCYKEHCPGCLRLMDFEGEPGSCLKGYCKLLYIRTIYGRSCLESTNIFYNIIFIFIFLIFTPFYIGFISSFIGIFPHPNVKSQKINNDKMDKIHIICTYCNCRGFLMFPYFISFFPFLVLILIPGIFSKKYFYRIMVMFLSALIPGGIPFKNLTES